MEGVMFEPFREEEKRRYFNKFFWQGFFFGSVVFIALNVASYINALSNYKKDPLHSLGFSPPPRFEFGFPFPWIGISNEILNLMAFFILGIVFGMFVRRLKSQTS